MDVNRKFAQVLVSAHRVAVGIPDDVLGLRVDLFRAVRLEGALVARDVTVEALDLGMDDIVPRLLLVGQPALLRCR